jgi:hypothetical protein
MRSRLKLQISNSQGLWFLIILVLLILVAVDRGFWATVSQWREDQAANLWLGYTQNPLAMPVGLISSTNLPNPNGMPLLAVLLSRLPNLWTVSTFLGILQGALVLWIGWLIAGRSARFFLLTVPALVSVILCASSVEFWNQWLMTSINLLFFGFMVLYLRRPVVWKIPLLIVPMLLAPAVYLAGLDNAIIFFVLAAAAVLVRRPSGRPRAWILSTAACLVLVGLSLWLTWIPYFGTADIKKLTGTPMTMADLESRVTLSAQSVFNFPLWGLTQWAYGLNDTFYQSSTKILPVSAIRLLRLIRFLNLGQSLIFLSVLILAVAVWIYKRRPFSEFFLPGQQQAGSIVLIGIAFVILAFALSPLLSGPAWANRDRLDQTVQFLPFFLFAWFSLPFLVRLPRLVQSAAIVLTIVLAAAFFAVNLILGVQVIQSHLDYRGSFLSEADVPLQQKDQAVDFIARDWSSFSTNKSVPVTYSLGGGRWDYVPLQGEPLEKWYPAPMTLGRSFDFELLREYGLHNSQEGIQFRATLPARYIVTYAFLPAPSQPDLTMKNYIFGRLRVSVVQ